MLGRKHAETMRKYSQFKSAEDENEAYEDDWSGWYDDYWDEWNPHEVEEEVSAKDFNGTPLVAGDKITLAKDLKVKGSSLVLKIGTKAVIRHVKDAKDHQLDCKVDGAGEMMLTAQFVKKA